MTLFILGGLGIGCATTAPPALPLTTAERIQRDQAIGTEIARQFDAQLKIHQDKEIAVYLAGVGQTLCNATADLGGARVEVLTIQDRNTAWRNFGLPGHRIYLSSSLLKEMHFENEIAGAIAFELAHIAERHILTRLQEEVVRVQGKPASASLTGAGSQMIDYPEIEGLFPGEGHHSDRPVEYLGPLGVFAFSDDFYLAAVTKAVQLLYRSGYDPRGLASMWQMYLEEPDHSPLSEELLQKLIEKTRREIALYSPLRNPIVRSQAFLRVQKRIQRL
ncbi:M48 family metalloprotease [Bdellovibrionota bacterium FG-1]